MNKWSGFKKFMIISAIISTILTILIFILYKIIEGEILETLSITFFTIAYHLDIRLIIGNIIPLYKNKININSKYFELKKFEDVLYKKIKVKKWKSKVPAYSPEEFDINKQTLEEIVRNICNSEIVHTANIIASYIPLFFIIFFGTPAVFIITSVLVSLIDLFLVIIQRYNRPRLIKVIGKMKNII